MNARGGGIMLFIRDNIRLRLLKRGNLLSKTKALFIEINLRKKKWPMCCINNPSKSLINKFTYDIGKVLDSNIYNQGKVLIIGDLISAVTESPMHGFFNSYNLHSLCHSSTCTKNPENPLCIDLFLTNYPRSFQNSRTIQGRIQIFGKEGTLYVGHHGCQTEKISGF